MTLRDYLAASSTLLKHTGEAIQQDVVDRSIEVIVAALLKQKPVLVCGNGGSASDAMHITTELVGRFLQERRPLKVICLCDNPALLTAWSNDYRYETVFARQVEAYGEKGGVLLGISTSGQSKNVLAAFEQARKMEMTTIALAGEGGGLNSLADYLLRAPSGSTPLIQQVHICLYHYLCQGIEEQIVARTRS